jgi:hypothetical protein
MAAGDCGELINFAGFDEAELCCSITDRDRVSLVRVVLVADQRQWLARMQDERAKASVLSIEASASLRDQPLLTHPLSASETESKEIGSTTSPWRESGDEVCDRGPKRALVTRATKSSYRPSRAEAGQRSVNPVRGAGTPRLA